MMPDELPKELGQMKPIDSGRNVIMLMYLQFITSGNTYYHKRTKIGTILKMFTAAAAMIATLHSVDPRNVYQEFGPDKFEPLIQAEIDRYKKFETMPDLREPWLPQMQVNLDEFNTTQDFDQDSLACSVADWTCAGLQIGFRVSEYAQPLNKHRHLNTFAPDRDDPELKPRAFILPDVEVLNGFVPLSNEMIFNAASDTEAWNLATDCTLTFRNQKNRVKMEKKRFTKMKKAKHLCVVYRIIVILRRFFRLVGFRTDIPICVYRNADGKVENITSQDINRTLQTTACRTQ
ncbi:MAG: hypothetical protein SGARI_000406 [Bacillariaceae sp.]